jgi:hypothetical protein
MRNHWTVSDGPWDKKITCVLACLSVFLGLFTVFVSCVDLC